MPTRPLRRAKAGLVVLAYVLDTVFVLLFAVSGRSQHGEAATIAGLWHTAWPFLVALTLVWIAASVWRAPVAVVRSGVPVWLGTVVIGMLLRVLFTNGGAALPFVLVATVFLSLTIIGWRLLASLVGRLRNAR